MTYANCRRKNVFPTYAQCRRADMPYRTPARTRENLYGYLGWPRYDPYDDTRYLAWWKGSA